MTNFNWYKFEKSKSTCTGIYIFVNFYSVVFNSK